MQEHVDKRRFPRAAALAVAREFCAALTPVTLRLCVAGSLRRGKAEVGDVEILYVPQCEERQIDLVHIGQVDLAAAEIERLLRAGILGVRVSDKGAKSWGPQNKLAVHTASGIPVDLFAATEENWWNYLVCRTGPAESNIRICEAARKKGWKWNPYGSGFSRAGDEGRRQEAIMMSEAAVFEFVGLPCRPPHLRR